MVAGYLGSAAITGIYRGATPIQNVYRGSVPIWSASSIRDDFARADADTLGDDWDDEGTSDDYFVGITDETAKIQIPDGLIGGSWDYRISMQRYNVDTLDGDDGFVEARAASKGDGPSGASSSGYNTDVMGRVTDDDFDRGVGFRLRGGQCYLASRSGDDTDALASGGTFQAGDVIRATFIGTTGRLYVNGEQVAVDTIPAASGAGYRSLGIRLEGAKDFFGPRRFSPTLDYVMMG